MSAARQQRSMSAGHGGMEPSRRPSLLCWLVVPATLFDLSRLESNCQRPRRNMSRCRHERTLGPSQLPGGSADFALIRSPRGVFRHLARLERSQPELKSAYPPPPLANPISLEFAYANT
jgi:hypothetical protein